MTYVALTPLASDSPGIFPAQAQQNFTRLEEIISADHQFNNTAQANDGYHNLIHMTQQAPTGALANVGRLYTKIAAGTVELFYMNDVGREFQVSAGPIKITGTAIGLATGDSALVFANPGYDYTAVATVYINSTVRTNSAMLLKTGALASATIYSTTDSTFSLNYIIGPPTDLYVTNLTGSAQDIVWSIIISRTT